MTEQEWLDCSDPQPMLEAIRGRISVRQAWSFIGACNRRLLPLIHRVTNEEGAAQAHRKVALIERFVDGVATEGKIKELTLGHRFELDAIVLVEYAKCDCLNVAKSLSGPAVMDKRFSNRTRERRDAAREAY